MTASLSAVVRAEGEIPLGWAGSTTEMNYLNFGDSLSPVMTALVAGVPVRRVPAKSQSTRMSAIGAIAHTFEGGQINVWGTGCSPWKNPSAPPDQRVAFTPPLRGDIVLHATSGPIAEKLLTGGSSRNRAVHGDPAWLLPRFYQPKIRKKWALGVILHLSELADRSFDAHPLKDFVRYGIPESLRGEIHLITTVTPVGVEALHAKLDEILACERIVSLSMHGMVIAEAYGIPCLYFSPLPDKKGLAPLDLDPDGPSDLRIVDLYQGLGRRRLTSYFQDRTRPTDWEDVIEAIDRAWEPVAFDANRLIDAFPCEADPIEPRPGQTVWEHPIVKELKLQHDVALLRRQDQEAGAEASAAAGGKPERKAPTLGTLPRMPVRVAAKTAPKDARISVPAEPRSQERSGSGSEADMSSRTSRLLRMNQDRISIPLSWAATTRENPHANLGDTLSALIVGGMAGLPVRRAGFDQAIERMVAVGTIGHNQRNGVLHFWGTGVDADRNPVDPLVRGYVRPLDTTFNIHALRGPNSARTLRAAGVPAPDIFGDPVWMLPRFWPLDEVEKTHDLGVILHITELETRDPGSGPKEILKRYAVPEDFKGKIRLINTHCAPTAEAMREKVAEIVSCKAIVSTSLHGLVISETYGIPCAWFATYGDGEGRLLDLNNPNHQIDHRMRDFYSGVGRETLSSYCLERSKPTDWAAVLKWVHDKWRPLNYDDRPLIEAFPMPLAVSADDRRWELPSAIMDKIDF